jgi:hypothetical protein
VSAAEKESIGATGGGPPAATGAAAAPSGQIGKDVDDCPKHGGVTEIQTARPATAHFDRQPMTDLGVQRIRFNMAVRRGCEAEGTQAVRAGIPFRLCVP